MSNAYSTNRTVRRGVARPLAIGAFALGSVALGALNAASRDLDGGAAIRYAYGPAQTLGDGTARVYVALDAAGKPASLGVALSEKAMRNLPQTPMPGMPSAAMLMLELPAEAKATGFDHVMLDWNPQGHEPEKVYTLPHFDFHFYTISEEEQRQIVPNAPDFAKKANNIPENQYVPAGYVSAHTLMKVEPVAATIPLMGVHWLAGNAHELHGQTFTGTFLYGSYDGRFIFVEPMITKAYIESVKSAPGGVITAPVSAPSKVHNAGLYPTQYSITWNAGAKEYRISLDGLAKRD